MFDERDPVVRRILTRYEEISAANEQRAEQLRQDVDTQIETLAEAKKKREEEFQRKVADAEAEHARIEAEKKKEDGEEEEKERSLDKVWAKPKRRVDKGPSFGFEGDDEYYPEEQGSAVEEPVVASAAPIAVSKPAPEPVKPSPPVEEYDDDEGYDGSWLRG